MKYQRRTLYYVVLMLAERERWVENDGEKSLCTVRRETPVRKNILFSWYGALWRGDHIGLGGVLISLRMYA